MAQKGHIWCAIGVPHGLTPRPTEPPVEPPGVGCRRGRGWAGLGRACTSTVQAQYSTGPACTSTVQAQYSTGPACTSTVQAQPVPVQYRPSPPAHHQPGVVPTMATGHLSGPAQLRPWAGELSSWIPCTKYHISRYKRIRIIPRARAREQSWYCIDTVPVLQWVHNRNRPGRANAGVQ
jgi:hypothetical protein